MSATARSSKRERAELTGDGFLLTMGTMTVALAVPFGVPLLLGDSAMSGAVAEVGSLVLMLVGGVSGVVIAWVLHRRRITTAAAIGGIIGAAAGGFLIPAAAGISFLLGLPLRLVTDSEYAGPLALLIVVSVGVAALLVWLLADSVGDLIAGRREHVSLDVARIAAAIVFAVLVSISVYLIFAQPGPEQGEAPIWAIAAGLIAAAATAGAEVANVVWERQKSASAESPSA
jgi:hypothetical protein